MLIRWLLLLALLAGGSAQAEVMLRELGDFELKLGTAPTRSMAQGLIQPARIGTFHGGLDLTHANGWYFGNWVPSMGLDKHGMLEVDSYLGYASGPDDALGYELGLIRYGYPEQPESNRHEIYAGVSSLFGSRLGAALSEAPGRADTTLLMDVGRMPWDLGLTFKYASHALDKPVQLSGGRSVRVFNDWSLNLSRPWLGTQFDLSFSASDLSGPGCAAYSGQNAYCEEFLLLRLERPLF